MSVSHATREDGVPACWRWTASRERPSSGSLLSVSLFALAFPLTGLFQPLVCPPHSIPTSSNTVAFTVRLNICTSFLSESQALVRWRSGSF